jgi:hypothetical protein
LSDINEHVNGNCLQEVILDTARRAWDGEARRAMVFRECHIAITLGNGRTLITEKVTGRDTGL